MARHFKPLAMRNKQDMKWKKFFYRVICADAAYTLCTAPSCGECDDFDHCFGEGDRANPSSPGPGVDMRQGRTSRGSDRRLPDPSGFDGRANGSPPPSSRPSEARAGPQKGRRFKSLRSQKRLRISGMTERRASGVLNDNPLARLAKFAGI